MRKPAGEVPLLNPLKGLLLVRGEIVGIRPGSRRAAPVATLIDAVFDRHSRTSIIRIDLYYHAEAKARLRVKHVFDELGRLIAEHELNVITPDSGLSLVDVDPMRPRPTYRNAAANV